MNARSEQALERPECPRYFRYKTTGDIQASARLLGVELALADNLGSLFEPVSVAGRAVGNRLAIQPMEGCDANLDGTPGELTVRRFRRFGAGGAKLIWGEACAVVPEGRANTRQLLINEANASAIEQMLKECRRAHRLACEGDSDLLVGLQLTHSGRYSCGGPVLAQHDPLLDPRTVVDPATRAHATAETPLVGDDALLRLQDRFVEAARWAHQVGFSFVDLKQCHRYLLNELLAAHTRPGRFGGSFENRTRFAREVLERIAGECPGLMLATRLNVFDGLPFFKGPNGVGVASECALPQTSCWGTAAHHPHRADLSEPLKYVNMLAQLGVSLINISMGNPYASPHLLRPFEYPPPDGYETPEHPLLGVARHFELAAQVQRACPQLAVVGSGYSWLQAFALPAGAANVRAGAVTFVGLGRAALAGPDFAARAAAGQPPDPKHTCRTFSYCTALMRAKHNNLGQFATGCPPFDKDVYAPIWKEAQKPTASAAVQAARPQHDRP